MRTKPKGSKYRNLTAREGVIYYQRRVDGKRVRFSCATSDWEEAVAVRDLYEARSLIGTSFAVLQVPEFAEASERYLREATGHFSPSTKEDRESLLGEKGILTRHFGSMRLDSITRATLLEWWHQEVESRGRAHRTGMNYLNAISSVMGHALDLELLSENPVDSFRATLRRRRRTQRGRAEAEQDGSIHAIESVDELRAFVEASEKSSRERFETGRPVLQRRDGHVADILQLDAGLRWGHIVWGNDPTDTTRALVIQESRSRGRHSGPTKSGRKRRVALSLRLRKLLREYWIAKGQPGEGERVLPQINPQNYAARHFAKVCEVAKLEGRSPKDLRDTFASQLLTSGVQLGYVSKQLGHADVSVTARHYARWVEGDGYRASMTVEPGEVPADLIARITKVTPQVTPVSAHGVSRE